MSEEETEKLTRDGKSATELRNGKLEGFSTSLDEEEGGAEGMRVHLRLRIPPISLITLAGSLAGWRGNALLKQSKSRISSAWNLPIPLIASCILKKTIAEGPSGSAGNRGLEIPKRIKVAEVADLRSASQISARHLKGRDRRTEWIG